MPSRMFDDNLYRFDLPQASYWEATATDIEVDAAPLAANHSCDVAIIGGGYTGLSAALHLARDHGIEARVLEAGHLGWGASGRNGGFCCIGGTAVHARDLVRMFGVDAARDYYRSQVEAVELVRALGSDEELDYQPLGSAEVVVAHSAKAFADLRKEHAALTQALGMQAELFGADEARRRIYDSTENHGALSLAPAFGLHPLRYCKGLANAALRRGAHLHPHSEVVEWTRDDRGTHRLVTRGGTVRARRVIFATNGFMPEELHDDFYGRTLPVISAIVVTRHLDDDEKAAQGWVTEQPVANSRRVLNYFRVLPDGRFLFGGRGQPPGSVAGERQTYAMLADTMRRLWPAWREVDIEYRWHGLVCINATLRPSIGRLDEDATVFFGYGYQGNGVNTASWAGKQLADWLAADEMPSAVPAIVRGIGRRYPLPRLRPAYFRLGLSAARLLDRWL